MSFTGEQIIELAKTLPGILAAVASLIIAIKAQKSARSAQKSAEAAHITATNAAREQLTFALKRAVRDAKAQGVLLHASVNDVNIPSDAHLHQAPPPGEGGTP